MIHPALFLRRRISPKAVSSRNADITWDVFNPDFSTPLGMTYLSYLIYLALFLKTLDALTH